MHRPTPISRLVAVLAPLGVWFPWLVAVLITVQLTRWGGLPSSGLTAFWLGVGAMIAVALTLALVGRRLLAPAPGVAEAVDGRPGLYRLLAALLLLSGFAIGAGAFWDEIWHRQYGIPFGEDLFWRPHLLMYGGLLGVIALAGVAFVTVLGRDLRGVWRRLRARPALAMLVILGAFLLYSLPADPAWHVIYGQDISAWSLPHLLLAFNFAAITLVAVALLQSASPPRPWRGLRKVVAGDAFSVVAFAFALNLLLQVLTTEWDNIRFVPTAGVGAFWDRPEWLLPALLAALAALIGTLALRSSRLIGAATLTGLTALALRWLMLQAFRYDAASTDAWLLLLPPLVTLDLLFLAQRHRDRRPRWWLSGAAVSLGATVGTLPLIGVLLVYPSVGLGSLPAVVVSMVVAAAVAAWAGDRLGSWLAEGPGTGTVAPPPTRGWQLPLLAVALAGFVVWFIVSAPPPV